MIEVEIKFPLDRDQENAITSRSKLFSEKVMHDIYYDYPDHRLMLSDNWLRLRDEKFELKQSPGGPGYNIGKRSRQYHELTDDQSIMKALNISGENLPAALAANKIQPLIEIKTNRKSYRKDDFRIDIDHTDSGYYVGEIELLVESETDIPAAEKSLINFLETCGIESLSVQRGKVDHYIQKNNPDLFKQFIIAGVVEK